MKNETMDLREYNWGINDFLNAEKQLLVLINKTNNPKEKAKFEYYLKQCQKVTNILLHQMDNQTTLKNEFEAGPVKYSLSDDTIKIIKEFQKVASENKIDFALNNGGNRNFSHDEIISITHDFYKNCGSKKIFNLFNQIYKERYSTFKFNSSYKLYGATTAAIGGINKLFISIDDFFGLESITFCIHECAHGIDFLANPIKFLSMNSLFHEAVPAFIDLLAYDYLAKNIDKATAYNNLYARFDYYSSTFIEDILFVHNLINLYKEKQFTSGINFQRFLKKNDEDKLSMAKKVLVGNINPKSKLDYVMSYMIGVELYETYLIDPDKAFYMLFKLISIKADIYEKYNVEKIITFNKSMEAYTHRITKR